MRRLTSFVLLGPFLSWLVFVAMLTPKLLTRPTFENGAGFFSIALLVCYLGGVPVMLALAGIDRALSRYWWRIIVVAVVGFVTAFGLFYYFSRGGPERDFREYWFFLGLMGAIPAAAGSWLSRASNGADD